MPSKCISPEFISAFTDVYEECIYGTCETNLIQTYKKGASAITELFKLHVRLSYDVSFSGSLANCRRRRRQRWLAV